MSKSSSNSNLVENRQARHQFEILETLIAGIALVGTEVKSCRAHDISLADAYAAVDKGELWLYNCHIAPYGKASRFNHEPTRPRKLLVRKCELRRLARAVEAKGMTLVPLRLFLHQGLVKVDLGLCRGKNLADKRETLKQKTADRELRRALRGR
ncbi:MAG: SsrA-binding protein SmpB [Lentisphaeria bacterium]|jgi:SsrA-binding protein